MPGRWHKTFCKWHRYLNRRKRSEFIRRTESENKSSPYPLCQQRYLFTWWHLKRSWCSCGEVFDGEGYNLVFERKDYHYAHPCCQILIKCRQHYSNEEGKNPNKWPTEIRSRMWIIPINNEVRAKERGRRGGIGVRETGEIIENKELSKNRKISG